MRGSLAWTADVVAHVLLGTLHSEPILELLGQGEAHRLATVLKAMAGALLAEPA